MLSLGHSVSVEGSHATNIIHGVSALLLGSDRSLLLSPAHVNLKMEGTKILITHFKKKPLITSVTLTYSCNFACGTSSECIIVFRSVRPSNSTKPVASAEMRW